MANSKFKSSLNHIPILGYFALIINGIIKLPKIQEEVINGQKRDLTLEDYQKTQQEAIDSINKHRQELEKAYKSLISAQDNLQGQFSLLDKASDTGNAPSKRHPDQDQLFANDHIMDSFYANFEDRFRGSESVIMKRLEFYLPYFDKSKLDFDKYPVLDIGSGRGEFIQLLKKNGINSIGLDINHDMVERSKNKGLKAVRDDALTYLQSSGTQKFSAITGFHIVEHIPFNDLLRIFQASHRALVIGGFVIFETPNPENLIVGSTTFYMDPSHLHPLPPLLLAFALENCGFRDVEIKRLHQDPLMSKSKVGKDVADLIYGPRDYAVIGYK